MDYFTKNDAASTSGKATRARRPRTEKKLVKVKVLKRTWWRNGTGTKLIRSEVVWEKRLVEVPVDGGREARHA